jgi:hypothetical protein
LKGYGDPNRITLVVMSEDDDEARLDHCYQKLEALRDAFRTEARRAPQRPEIVAAIAGLLADAFGVALHSPFAVTQILPAANQLCARTSANGYQPDAEAPGPQSYLELLEKLARMKETLDKCPDEPAAALSQLFAAMLAVAKTTKAAADVEYVRTTLKCMPRG